MTRDHFVEMGNSNFGVTDISHPLSEYVCRGEIWGQEIILRRWEIPTLERLLSLISYLNLFVQERHYFVEMKNSNFGATAISHLLSEYVCRGEI